MNEGPKQVLFLKEIFPKIFVSNKQESLDGLWDDERMSGVEGRRLTTLSMAGEEGKLSTWILKIPRLLVSISYV